MNSLLLTVVASVVFSGVALSQQPSPEDREYGFRTSLFQTFAWKMGQLAQAKGANDQAGFAKHAKDLAYLSTMTQEGFMIENNIPGGSLAKPAIWEDFDDFGDKAANLTSLSEGLLAEGAMDSFSPRQFGSKACGTCHREYKEKD